MQIHVKPSASDAPSAGALVVPVFADGRLDGAAQTADAALGGALADVLAAKEIKGAAGELVLLHGAQSEPKRVLVIGLGDRAAFKPAMLARFAGTAVRYLGKRNVTSIAFALPIEAAEHAAEAAGFLVEGALGGIIDSTTYRTEPEKPIVLDAITIVSKTGDTTFDATALEAGAKRGEIVGEAVNFARILALTPANDMTPSILASRAEDIAKKYGLTFHALGEAEMQAKGMGSILGVSRGSDEDARMIVMEYTGDPESKEKLALVGKGLTFDSGGISIKPAENMHEMKYDMCGGAGVIAAMGAIAQLKPKVNIIGIVPSSENLPGPRAMKPGDILHAMNGKTIEVINTDAEGRLILADGLCYARELGATKIVDAATLTGAMVVALGHSATGTISNDDAFRDHFIDVSKSTTEKYWPLPLYDEFSQTVKSEIADLRNSTGRAAGSLTAAAFLKAFVADVPWIHLDIAGTAYTDAETPYLAKGPTGYPVRAFVALAEDAAKASADGNGNGSAAKATNGAAESDGFGQLTPIVKRLRTLLRTSAAVFTVALVSHALAASAEEQQLHTYREVVLAPDASRVVAIEATEAAVDGDPSRSDLVIRPIGGSAPVTIALPCAPDPDCAPSSPAWSPDSKTLAFVLHPPKTSHRFIYETNADGTSLRKILDFEGTLVDLRFARDGKLTALATAGAHKEIGATQPGAPIVGVIGETTDEQRIAIVSPTGTANATLAYASPPDLFVYEYDAIPRGGFVGTAAHGNGDNNWWIAALYAFDGTGSAKKIYTQHDPQQQIATPRVAPDGKSVAFIGGLMSDFGSTGGDVFSVPVAGGDTTDLTSGFTATPTAIAWSCSSAAAHAHLDVTVQRGSDMELDAVDASTGGTATTAAPARERTFGEATVSSITHACVAGTERDAYVRQTFEAPPEIFMAPAESSAQAAQLTHVNDGLSAATDARSLAWTNDGTTVHGWLLAPPHVDGAAKHPLILTVHGGPAAATTPRFIGRGTTRDLLARGYYLFLPNPRGSFGEGESFARGNVKDFGYGDLRDDLSGVDAVEKIAPIDDARLGIQGGSYGGFMSMWAVTQTHRFKASVASAGIANWISYYGENGIDEWMIPYFGASAYDDPAVYRKSSPIEFIKNVTTPSLIIVGERDVECPAPQSQEYRHALDTLGVPTQLVIYAGEGHGLRLPKDRADAQKRTLAWFDRYLMPSGAR